jgi:hypothetical protein
VTCCGGLPPPTIVQFDPAPTTPVRRAATLEAGLGELQAPVEIARLDRPDKGVDPAAILSASPDVIAPAASAEVTAFVAAAISEALSISASMKLTAGSRQGGRMRSRQGRMAVGSPPIGTGNDLG